MDWFVDLLKGGARGGASLLGLSVVPETIVAMDQHLVGGLVFAGLSVVLALIVAYVKTHARIKPPPPPKRKAPTRTP